MSMSMLTEKERHRLAEVRRKLKEGENPYSTISTLTLGDSTSTRVPEDTLAAKLQRWKDKDLTVPPTHKGKHTTKKPIKGLDGVDLRLCVCCLHPITYLTSTLVKALDRLTQSEHISKRDYLSARGNVFTIELKGNRSFGRMKVGRACKECTLKWSQVNQQEREEWLGKHGTYDGFKPSFILLLEKEVTSSRTTLDQTDEKFAPSKSGRWRSWRVI